MSLQLAAQHMASRGRGPDTQLVHMAPQEVRGLQALARAHGGSLTVNPETGLAEAGFLKKILPMVLGAALAPLTAGTSLAFLGATPLASAMTVGAGYGLATGDLRKGLMAGLGAYGGANLGAGLNAAAGTVAPGAAGAVAPVEGLAGAAAPVEGLAGAAGQGAGVSVTPLGADPVNLSQTGPNLFGRPEAYLGPSQGPEALSVGLPPVTPPVTAAPITPPPAMPADFGAVEKIAPPQSSFARMRSGLEALGTPEGREAFIGKAASKGVEATGVGGYGGLAKSGLAAISPMMMGGEPEQYQGSGPNPFRYRYEQEMPEGPNTEGSAEALQYRGRYVPYAAGGPVQTMSDRNEALTLMANNGQMFAAGGGVSHLGDYSDGGRLLKGPGDGVSDSIPATIANKRPARLADGEFVIPARIVSELGNGSTEAGARKLYAMMDRVQKMRKKSIGKKRVAVNSRADRALPA